jgi:hypothetical protein
MVAKRNRYTAEARRWTTKQPREEISFVQNLPAALYVSYTRKGTAFKAASLGWISVMALINPDRKEWDLCKLEEIVEDADKF